MTPCLNFQIPATSMCSVKISLSWRPQCRGSFFNFHQIFLVKEFCFLCQSALHMRMIDLVFRLSRRKIFTIIQSTIFVDCFQFKNLATTYHFLTCSVYLHSYDMRWARYYYLFFYFFISQKNTEVFSWITFFNQNIKLHFFKLKKKTRNWA